MYTPDEDQIEQDDDNSSQDSTGDAEQAPEQAQSDAPVNRVRSTNSPIIINK